MKNDMKNSPSVDLREQTFNQGHCGPIGLVSTAIHAVALLRAIMFDIDLKLFRGDGPFSAEGLSPEQFYEIYVAKWLDNHPVLRKAEVRFSGNGFHVLLKLANPIALSSDNLRKRWEAILKIVQMALPIDLQQPGINALTRPEGSVNSKNCKTVTCLRPGEPVLEQEVFTLFEEMRQNPFRTILNIWFGSEKVTPCPICRKANSYLEATSPKAGQCYSCGSVSINSLFRAVLHSPNANFKGGKMEQTNSISGVENIGNINPEKRKVEHTKEIDFEGRLNDALQKFKGTSPNEQTAPVISGVRGHGFIEHPDSVAMRGCLEINPR